MKAPLPQTDNRHRHRPCHRKPNRIGYGYGFRYGIGFRYGVFLALSLLPTLTRAEVFSKDILSLRDPFKHPLVTGGDSRVPEIETFPTEQFKFLGVVLGAKNTRAMVLGPNGKTYFVHERMRIGIRKGVITHINEDRIVVRERFVNVLGQEEIADVPIEFPPEQFMPVEETRDAPKGATDKPAPAPVAPATPAPQLNSTVSVGALPAVPNPVTAPMPTQNIVTPQAPVATPNAQPAVLSPGVPNVTMPGASK
jgi:hypothetical protein